MNPTALAQDANILADELLAIVDADFMNNPASAIDKMREAAHLLAQLAALMGRSLSDPAYQRDLRKNRERIGHDIGTEEWHREQALWADKHRPRQDDIGQPPLPWSEQERDAAEVILHQSALIEADVERIVNNTLGRWAQAVKDTDSHVTVTPEQVDLGALTHDEASARIPMEPEVRIVSIEWQHPAQISVIDDDDHCPDCGCSITKSEAEAGGCEDCRPRARR